MRARSTRLADSVRDRASRSNSDRSSSEIATAAVGAGAPYTSGHAQAGRLALARLAVKVKAAAFKTPDVEQRPRERDSERRNDCASKYPTSNHGTLSCWP